ncbi:hypothetical protein GUJ93_ZPchr0015g6974 [Zizania palustris]|uniref:Uncharacterized protein n=1 Tax=Zizania palustris TaxID=103762 RepID=A0A8J5TGH5_ZIZPA|nr:hypothetical protein GUJ93_ZPchr0015g6974 [Zizania palustris]
MAAASGKDKDGSNNGEDEKTGYMHMRARRGLMGVNVNDCRDKKPIVATSDNLTHEVYYVSNGRAQFLLQ